MKKKSLIIILTFYSIFIFSLSSCNSKAAPYEIFGTWTYINNSFSLSYNRTVIGFTPQLENKIIEACNKMSTILVDPHSIILDSEGNFRFIFKSNDVATGSYSLDKQILTFIITSGHYPEVESLFAVTDGELLELYFGILSFKQIFVSLLELSDEELHLLFREENPVINRIDASILYQKNLNKLL